MNQLSEILRSARSKARLSQEDVAKSIGVSQRAYSYWENGERMPDQSHLIKISSVLKIDGSSLAHAYSSISEHSQTKDELLNTLLEIKTSLDRLEIGQNGIGARLWGHIIRSSERYAGENPKKTDFELDRIDNYVRRFLEAGQHIDTRAGS